MFLLFKKQNVRLVVWLNVSALHSLHDASLFLLLFKDTQRHYNLFFRRTSTPKVSLCVMEICTLFQCHFNITVISAQYGQCKGSAY